MHRLKDRAQMSLLEMRINALEVKIEELLYRIEILEAQEIKGTRSPVVKATASGRCRRTTGARRRCLWLSGNRLIAWRAQALSRIIDDRVPTTCRSRADHEPTARRPRADRVPTEPTTAGRLHDARAIQHAEPGQGEQIERIKPDDEPTATTDPTSSPSRSAVQPTLS